MRVAKLQPDAKLPTRNHFDDAGIDLYSLDYAMITQTSEAVIRTGITVEIPKGCFGFIHAKGRSNFLIGGGIVDEGYQGEILVKIVNYHQLPITIGRHEAIAQMLIIPCVLPRIEEVDKKEMHLKPTERSSTGGIVDQGKYTIAYTYPSKINQDYHGFELEGDK